MSLSVSSSGRLSAVRRASERKTRVIKPPKNHDGKRMKVSDYFGSETFSKKEMKQRLMKETYEKLQNILEEGGKLDAEVANRVASAVKDWALEKGATHFCHWFQPLTGATAEKHDAFLDIASEGEVMEKFTGSMLIQSEPDASSFPSGGTRTTFEARGYTAWDPSSPMFIMDSPNGKTLCIPSAYISYTGHALDTKTALVRSMDALSERATELLQLMGFTSVRHVTASLGIEQEFFLIDREFFALRPDLIQASRALLGAMSPKGQQMEDHYFGAIPTRVQALMNEVEFILYKLGVPIKTRHNEVAPSQFEMAPIFEEANVAVDHNQLTMEILKRVARKHGFRAMLHEKPFAGVNGNGKHCNWSMVAHGGAEDMGGSPNLLDPGKDPRHNLRFLMILVGVLKAVRKHCGLMRASIASSANDHRLGANEAPPAIVSTFLGQKLTEVLDEIEKNKDTPAEAIKMLSLGAKKLPDLTKDNTDRNRTSPFAFTGNKFEFRAVGGSSSPAFPITVINSAVAEAFSELTEDLRKELTKTKDLEKACYAVIRRAILETKAIRFEGNNYSEEWVKEAKKRKLPVLPKTPEALGELKTKTTKELMKKFNILQEDEVEMRYNIWIERYVKEMMIEEMCLREMVQTQILPACFKYHRMLSQSLLIGKKVGAAPLQKQTMKSLEEKMKKLLKAQEELEVLFQKQQKIHDEVKLAEHFAHTASPKMDEVRAACDTLELLVDDALWPLPKYREILFLR